MTAEGASLRFQLLTHRGDRTAVPQAFRSGCCHPLVVGQVHGASVVHGRSLDATLNGG